MTAETAEYAHILPFYRSLDMIEYALILYYYPYALYCIILPYFAILSVASGCNTYFV